MNTLNDIAEFRQGRKKGSRNKRKKLRLGSSAVGFVPAGAAIGSIGGIVGATLSKNVVRNMKFGVPIATVAGGLTGYGVSRAFDKKYKMGAYEK